MLDFIEGRWTGRLLSYDLETGATEILRDDLGFANGVAVDARGDVWLAETLGARITRIADHAAAGRQRLEILPAYPDNLSFGATTGTLWVALPAVRPNPVERLAAWPFVRKVLTRIPGVSNIEVKPYSMVIGLDADGRVIRNLQDPEAGYPTITSVKEINGYLYFGSIKATALGRLQLPATR